VNWLDFLILALVAWLTLSAYMTGLIRETVGLASVILGVAMAGLFHDNVATNLALLAGEGAGTEIGAYLLIFAVVLTIGVVASFILRSATRLFFLGWADHAGGALFGFFKAVLIVQAVIVIFVLQPALGMEDAIASSAIGSFFLDTTPVVRALLPEEFDSAIREFRLS
jgi:membrane protein required for colicin V production